MKKNIFNLVLSVIIICTVIFLDLYSKYLIEENIILGESCAIIKDFFSLTYVRNTGAAFSMLTGGVNYLIIFSLLVMSYLFYEAYKNIKVKSFVIFMSILIGGIIGNLYDRIRYNYVRDFLDFNIFGYDFAVFNVSDIFIVIGTILITIFILVKGDEINENKSIRRKRKKN